MHIRRCFKYRLYPGTDQGARLQWTLDRCRELYNAALEERRAAYHVRGISVTQQMQSTQLHGLKRECPEYRDVGSQVLQDTLQRLDRAFQAFFRRVQAGQTAGFPRFRSRDRYDSFTFKQAGWKLAGSRLHLAHIGALRVQWSRPIEGTIKTLTIRRDADQWYVCFSCVVYVPDGIPLDKPAIGIDMGLEHFATLSDGTHIANPRHFHNREAVLARRQQALARKKRGSKRRAKARLLVARAHRKVRNQRRDFHHKATNSIIAQAGAIAVEALNTANMVKNHCLAKCISDAGWGRFLVMLEWKAVEAAIPFIAVNPSGTSQRCSGCGATVMKTLADRWHSCHCGTSLQRDHNAALNILARAGLARQGAVAS